MIRQVTFGFLISMMSSCFITVIKIAAWCFVCPADREAWRGSRWHAWCFHRLLCLEYFAVGQSHCRGDIDDVWCICRVLQYIQQQNKTAGGKSARHRYSIRLCEVLVILCHYYLSLDKSIRLITERLLLSIPTNSLSCINSTQVVLMCLSHWAV